MRRGSLPAGIKEDVKWGLERGTQQRSGKRNEEPIHSLLLLWEISPIGATVAVRCNSLYKGRPMKSLVILATAPWTAVPLNSLRDLDRGKSVLAEKGWAGDQRWRRSYPDNKKVS